MPLSVREYGPKDAPTLLLLHGGGVSGWMWEPHVPLLPDFHLLAPDLPEHGASADTGPFSIARSAELVAGLIQERAHGGRAYLAGLSLGAQVGAALLAHSPDLVDRALLSATLVRPMPGAGLMRWLLKLYAPWQNQPWLVRANMKSQGIPEHFFAQFAADTRAATADRMGRIFTENLGFALPHGLVGCSVPTLVVVGEKEPRLMHQSALDLMKSLPAAVRCILPGAIHNWPVADPDQFARLARGWFRHGRVDT